MREMGASGVGSFNLKLQRLGVSACCNDCLPLAVTATGIVKLNRPRVPLSLILRFAVSL